MVGEVEETFFRKNNHMRNSAPKNDPLTAKAFRSRRAHLALHLAQLLCTIGRALTAAGTALYNTTPGGYRPVRAIWDHDKPNWSREFYEALGRQTWERRR